MADAGFFKGTSAEQDSRFANKQKKLLKQMKFPDNIDVKVSQHAIEIEHDNSSLLCSSRSICPKLNWMSWSPGSPSDWENC